MEEIAVVPRSDGKKRYLDKPITEQEKIFCDQIISGHSRTDALITAGYFINPDLSDKKVRTKMRNKGVSLMNKVGVTVYIQKNKDKIYITEDLDTAKLKRHIYEIAMGNAKGEFFDRKGICHECAPSFGDQIAAANAFIKMNEIDRKNQLKGIKTVTNDQIQVSKVQGLLDKYKFNKPAAIDEGIDVNFTELPTKEEAEKAIAIGKII